MALSVPLTPLRDLAQGLASRGIAALRYDKRTLAYASVLTMDENFTIDSETVDDALGAVAFLREQDKIDPERIYVIGHSLGAELTPRVLSRDAAIAGGIMLATPARLFHVGLAEQLEYVAEVNPAASDAPAMAAFQELVANFAAVEAGASYAEVFGEHATYMQSLHTLDPVADARGAR